jgi:methylated-DNA-[protein]-cysteine S-methyltransferase
MIHSIVDSPIGDLLLIGDGERLTALYTAENARRPEVTGPREDGAFAIARAQLAEYFAGIRREFDLELAPRGTDFQLQIWAELVRIPFGQTTSYRGLAERIGNPNAVRAVGMANGRNPISIVVPCHRVIGSDGTLTGYAGGLAAKAWLLAHEAAGQPAAAAVAAFAS